MLVAMVPPRVSPRGGRSAAPSPRTEAARHEDAATSLVQLHAQPLVLVAPPPPVRTKRKYTKRKNPGAVPEPVREASAVEEQLSSPERPKKLSKAKQRKLEATRERVFRNWRIKREAERRAREKREREERLHRWLNEGTDLPPHMTREPLPLPEVERPEPEIADKVEQKLVKTYKGRCRCMACRHFVAERHRAPDAQYRCRVSGCKQKFRDLAAFLDHQIDDHTTVKVHCRRTREEFARLQAGPLHPPLTVFIGFQFLNPTERPTLWTVEELEREKETLEPRLEKLSLHQNLPVRKLYTSFLFAYDKIVRYGPSQLKEQYRVALEHYESALVYPTATRNRQDVVSAIGVGRNWFVSPEPENAARARMLQLVKDDAREENAGDDNDDESEDDEVVLMAFGEVQDNENQGAPRKKKAKPSVEEKAEKHGEVEETKQEKMGTVPSDEEPEVLLL